MDAESLRLVAPIGVPCICKRLQFYKQKITKFLNFAFRKYDSGKMQFYKGCEQFYKGVRELISDFKGVQQGNRLRITDLKLLLLIPTFPFALQLSFCLQPSDCYGSRNSSFRSS